MKLRIRQASINDLDNITQFYRNNPRDTLPIPSLKYIAVTIEDYRVILLEKIDTSEILASAGIFRCSPRNSKTYVGELAGMLALPQVNGLKPVSAQTLLLGARLLGHMATDAEPGPGRTHSLITIVKDGNEKSLRNVLEAQFIPLDDRPDWFKYEELSWHGSIVQDQWRYFYASNETIVCIAKKLVDAGLLDRELCLSKTNRDTQEVENFYIHCELNDILNAAGEIHRLLRDEYRIDLCPPPADLVFWKG
jgi:hypothetical protein